MSMARAIRLLACFVAVAASIVFLRPHWVGDGNSFLKQFVNHEFLNMLGIILAVTLASAANIHLAFNRIEEQFGKPNGLKKSRKILKQAINGLVMLFACAVLLVLIKPVLVSPPNETIEAAFNLGSIFILFWHVLILVSVNELVLAIPPNFPGDANQD